MPVWFKDVQYGAAAGFIVIVGIVAIQFGFSAKPVLALLADVGVLFCASLFNGLPRAAMLGAGAVLLLLVLYDLATTSDRACQQSRAEAAQQRAAQEQVRLAAEQARLDAQFPERRVCTSIKTLWHFGTEKPDMAFNPAGQCVGYIWYDGHCIFLKRAGREEPEGPLCDPKMTGRSGLATLPQDGEYVWSADTPFDGYVQLNPPRIN